MGGGSRGRPHASPAGTKSARAEARRSSNPLRVHPPPSPPPRPPRPARPHIPPTPPLFPCFRARLWAPLSACCATVAGGGEWPGAVGRGTRRVVGALLLLLRLRLRPPPPALLLVPVLLLSPRRRALAPPPGKIFSSRGAGPWGRQTGGLTGGLTDGCADGRTHGWMGKREGRGMRGERVVIAGRRSVRHWTAGGAGDDDGQMVAERAGAGRGGAERGGCERAIARRRSTADVSMAEPDVAVVRRSMTLPPRARADVGTSCCCC